MEILQRYQEFLNRAMLQDQTPLIEALLKDEDNNKYVTSIQNKREYSVTLSDGEVVGSETLIKDLQIERKEQMTALTQEIILANDHETIYSLLMQKKVVEDDLKLLYNAYSKEKQILQWLLVPYWLSEELIQYGEVVFRYMGCNFWGLGYSEGSPLQKERILSEIFEELNY